MYFFPTYSICPFLVPLWIFNFSQNFLFFRIPISSQLGQGESLLGRLCALSETCDNSFSLRYQVVLAYLGLLCSTVISYSPAFQSLVAGVYVSLFFTSIGCRGQGLQIALPNALEEYIFSKCMCLMSPT
jgi:hypothetical protein